MILYQVCLWYQNHCGKCQDRYNLAKSYRTEPIHLALLQKPRLASQELTKGSQLPSLLHLIILLASHMTFPSLLLSSTAIGSLAFLLTFHRTPINEINAHSSFHPLIHTLGVNQLQNRHQLLPFGPYFATTTKGVG